MDTNEDHDAYRPAPTGDSLDHPTAGLQKVVHQGRVTISGDELTDMVSGAIGEMERVGATFTAYDITSRLRQDNPNSDILHSRVRILVEELEPKHGHQVLGHQHFGQNAVARRWGWRDDSEGTDTGTAPLDADPAQPASTKQQGQLLPGVYPV